MNSLQNLVSLLPNAARPISTPKEKSRRILCIFPRYTPSFGTFEYSYGLTMGTRAFMPPQGILLIAATLPKHWQVRFVDENMESATDLDFGWANAVFVSGMHIQRRQIDDICNRAHRFGKVAVLGGPSVSSCPDYYPSFDYLHVGEIGDATDDLIAILSHDVTRPERQVVLKTTLRRELAELPAPAYELAKINRYLLGSIQFSSGCPYKCEFCDIPGLYGRVPRLKTPQQIIAELERLVDAGVPGSVYFVDDNFIANRKAVAELLPHLIAWQKKRGYPTNLSCEATLNIARSPEILAMMREAGFETIFCGIETPDPDALKEMDKKQNLALPILDSVRAINQHGMQVVSGIILGLDSDTLETSRGILDFIEQSNIPMLTINLLQALPQTPLWDRLAKADRLVEDENRESNVRFLLPYDQVVAMWRNCMRQAYEPETLYKRYQYQSENIWPNRIPKPLSKARLSPTNIRRALVMLAKIFWTLGVRADYRRTFWKYTWPWVKQGKIEFVIATSVCAHHLIMFARDACAGRTNASNYAQKQRDLAGGAVPQATAAAE
jgi:hopanoid C-2 methylase